MPSTVQLLKVPEVGVPSTGVVKDGDVDKTTEPEPVDEVTPVPPLATANVAESPAALPVTLPAAVILEATTAAPFN